MGAVAVRDQRVNRFAQSFRELDVWKLSMEIARQTYEIAKTLPRDEEYGLKPQMKRAAISLSANIAEGFRRKHPKEFKQALHIALASSAELETYCLLCQELFNGSTNGISKLLQQLDRFQRMTNSLIGKLKT